MHSTFFKDKMVEVVLELRRHYPSVSAASRATGISRPTLSRYSRIAAIESLQRADRAAPLAPALPATFEAWQSEHQQELLAEADSLTYHLPLLRVLVASLKGRPSFAAHPRPDVGGAFEPAISKPQTWEFRQRI